MSNYSEQEIKNDFELTNEMSDARPQILNDIEVKIKPSSFENIKNKNATIYHVDKVTNKLVRDLNDTFIPKLNGALEASFNHIFKLDTRLSSNSDRLDKLTEELDNLKSEFEKSKASDDIIDEWEAPSSSEIL